MDTSRDRLIDPSIDPSIYDRREGGHARKDGDQEGAPSQRALAGGAGHHPGHDGPHEGVGICGEVQCPQLRQRRARVEEGTVLPGAAQEAAQGGATASFPAAHRASASEEDVRTAWWWPFYVPSLTTRVLLSGEAL